MRRENLIAELDDTLEILEKGCYQMQGRTVRLKLNKEQMEEVKVFLPQDVQEIYGEKDFAHVRAVRYDYSCINKDSFTVARKRMEQLSHELEKDAKPVLVLNLANPVNPGGGVREGAKAHEEDLCRTSSLLLSLESSGAAPYYVYNRSLHTYMGSDAVMIHPQVEIIKDENGDLLPETTIVAVMTCAAPMLTFGYEGLSEQQYEEMVFERITGMLKVAAYLGYQYLVLGAFGCGAFENDARVVSDLFYKALKEFDFDGMKSKDMFRRIDFAVLDRSKDKYNFNEFSRNFRRFHEYDNGLDTIRGCLFGGAAGDALGYPVEFLSERQIFDKYGPAGITYYEKDPKTGKALISDDTQMTLFTANGLLVRDTQVALCHVLAWPRKYVAMAYQDWLKTQESSIEEVNRHERLTEKGGYSWLLDVPELYARRAPGNTCLSALEYGTDFDDFIESKRNDSKGCGGIMRVAPYALNDIQQDIGMLDEEGAQLAAITHSHPLGYMPAAVLVHIINRIRFPLGSAKTLKEVVLEARDTVAELFRDDPYIDELTDIINKAVQLSENDSDDITNIHRIGEGWVAEETLGIALYCALKYQNDFSAGIIAAVNHNGDSDSTGAVTGNILGALLGFDAIADQWKKDLELSDVIMEVADDLYKENRMDWDNNKDTRWLTKYMDMHRPTDEQNDSMDIREEELEPRNRTELLRILLDQQWSGQQMVKLTGEMSGKSEEEKEEIAARLIRQIENGEIKKE